MDSGSVALGSSAIELYGSADVEYDETIYANRYSGVTVCY